MKSVGTFVATILLFLPSAACAQNNAPQTPTPDPGRAEAGQILIGQAPPDGPRVFIQKRDAGPGGPDTAFMMNPEPGMGLGAWWKNSEIVSKLQLSDDQVKKISQTFLEHKLKLIDLQADVEKQELRLQPLLDADHPDTSEVGSQIDLITTARGRLEKANAMMMLAVRSELTVDQWKKLKGIQAARDNEIYIRTGRVEGAAPFPGPLPAPPPPPR